MSIRRAQDERIEGTPDGLNAITEISDVPDFPTIGSPSDVGTSRAYNNAAATIAVTSNATGGTPTSYTVTSSPGSLTGTGTSPVTVTGLNSETSYTFTAVATNTTGSSSVSTSSNSVTVTSVPATPSAPVATNQGTSRAYNNGQASVAFSAPASGGKTITSYTVTSNPGSFTASGSTSPLTITGLASATAYTYTVTATNANGTSSSSSASSSITATTVPQAPTIGTATASGLTASVTFTGNATGGSAITGYTVTSSPGNITGTGASSPITVSGLTGGTAYTFTVTATNANGTSAASAASNSITPVAYFMTSIDSGTIDDTGMATHCDSSGNVYVGGRIKISTTWYGYFAKFNSAGSILWQKTIYATNDSANAIASIGTDSSGNVYALGNYRAPSNTQTILIKTDSSGNTVWKKNYGAIYSDAPGNMIVNSTGTCYFVDHSAETGNGELLLAIVDTNGNLSFSKRVDMGIVVGSQAQQGNVSLTIDSSGNMYAQTRGYLAKINSNQTLAWGRAYMTASGTINQGRPSVDSSGNVYTATPWGSGSSIITKANSSGTYVWDRYVTATGITSPSVVGTAMDSSSNLYILFRDLNTSNGLYIRKYDSSANLIWTRKLTSSLNNMTSTVSDTIQIINDILYISGTVNNNIFLAKLPIDGSKTGSYVVGGATITYAIDSGTTNSIPGNTPLSNQSTSLANPTSVPFTTDTEVTLAAASLTISTILI